MAKDCSLFQLFLRLDRDNVMIDEALTLAGSKGVAPVLQISLKSDQNCAKPTLLHLRLG